MMKLKRILSSPNLRMLWIVRIVCAVAIGVVLAIGGSFAFGSPYVWPATNNLNVIVEKPVNCVKWGLTAMEVARRKDNYVTLEQQLNEYTNFMDSFGFATETKTQGVYLMKWVYSENAPPNPSVGKVVTKFCLQDQRLVFTGESYRRKPKKPKDYVYL